MALILRDRIKETTTTVGTDDIVLNGAESLFQSFSGVMSSGDTTYYEVVSASDWETGWGTWVPPNTITRDEIIESSTGGKISLTGTSTVFCTYPGLRSVYRDSDNHVVVNSGVKFTPLADTNYPAWQEGVMFYDAESKTVTVYNDESGVSMQVGQESYVRVRNNTVSDIDNGKVVYISGSQGTHPEISLADASGEDSSLALGVATHTISASSFGYVTTFGMVHGINTSGLTEGTACYLGNNGALLDDPAVPPNHHVKIGYVVTQHADNGVIFVGDHPVNMGNSHVGGSGDLTQSGIPYVSLATEDGDAIISTSTSFTYDKGNDRINLPTGGVRFSDNSVQNTAGAASGDNVSIFVNDAGYLTAHPSISAASDSDNSGRTYIQDILLDSNGHVTGIAVATETVVDTDTTYSAGSGLSLDGTTFNVVPTGDVFGPASSADNAIARFDGATGKLIQSSSATISDDGKLYTPSIYLGVVSNSYSGSMSLDFDLASSFNAALTGNITSVTFSNADPGQRILINIKQGGSGGYTITGGDWNNIKWTDDTAPTLSTAVGTVDTIGILVPSGTTYFGYVVGTGINDG